MLRTQLTLHRLAQAAIFIQFVASARSYGEVFRLSWEAGQSFTFAMAVPYLIGGNIALGFTWASSMLYFAGRDRLVLVATALMIVVLLIYKAMAIGLGA